MSRWNGGGAAAVAVRTAEPRAELYWKRGRAYVDARAWEAWGGKLEALVPAGERHATQDRVTAAILFGERLTELRALRSAHPEGLVPAASRDDPLGRIATFAGWYLAEKANRRGRKRVTETWLAVQEQRLAHAARFFAKRGCELLRDLGPPEVRAYMEDLRRNVPPRRDGRGSGGRGPLSPTTQRWYLDTLGELLQAAVAEGRIDRNWVSERNDLPTADPSPTKHLEIWEAALLLEGARRLYPLERGEPPIYPLLAFYLLTGVTESERAGVRVADVRLQGDPEFPGGAILVRPNAAVRQDRHQDQLKTAYRERVIPLHAQLSEILREYLKSPAAPTGPLLFTAARSGGSVPLGDWRRSLDRIATYCGFPARSVRTRRFRVTYCTHRAYTLDESGQAMTPLKLQAEMGHGSLEMIDRRYFRHTRLRAARPQLEFRWAEWEAQCGGRLGSNGRCAPDVLSPKLAAVLQALAPEGLTATEWEAAAGLPVGTFYYCRDRLVERGRVRKDGSGRGARFLPASQSQIYLREKREG